MHARFQFAWVRRLKRQIESDHLFPHAEGLSYYYYYYYYYYYSIYIYIYSI